MQQHDRCDGNNVENGPRDVYDVSWAIIVCFFCVLFFFTYLFF